MKIRRLLSLAPLLALLVLLAACTRAEPTPTATPEPEPALLYVFNGGSLDVSVIDTQTNQVVRTVPVEGVKAWGWIDDSNYFDGKNLWVANKDPDTKEAEVLLLDLDTFQVSQRIPLGTEGANIFISRASSQGQVFVSLLNTGEVVVIDSSTYEVVDRLAVNKIACDVDIAVGPDGVERVFIPNRDADTVQTINASTLEIITTGPQPEGSSPWMVTASPDGSQIWVQDQKGNTNSILDAVTLEAVKRIPTGNNPSMAAFSPDGSQVYAGHLGDTIVVVIDSETYQVLDRIEVGANPVFITFRPDGRYAYVTVRKENVVAVIDTSTRQVVQRIDVGENPFGVYMLSQ